MDEPGSKASAVQTVYNRIAGESVERLAALRDGIFGVAMTLLLLDLRVPAREVIHGEGDLRTALIGLCPQLFVYLMSFMTLGIFWVGQQTQINNLTKSDRHLTWLHPGLPLPGHDSSLLNPPARRIHRLPDGPAGLLAQHSSPRRFALCDLGPRDEGGGGQSVDFGRIPFRHQAPHYRSAGSLCVRSPPLLGEPVREHSGHHFGAAQFCLCPPNPMAVADLREGRAAPFIIVRWRIAAGRYAWSGLRRPMGRAGAAERESRRLRTREEGRGLPGRRRGKIGIVDAVPVLHLGADRAQRWRDADASTVWSARYGSGWMLGELRHRL